MTTNVTKFCAIIYTIKNTLTGSQCACAARGASRLATSERKRAAANHRRPQCVWKQHANTSRLTRVRNFLNQEALSYVISHQEQCLYDRSSQLGFNIFLLGWSRRETWRIRRSRTERRSLWSLKRPTSFTAIKWSRECAWTGQWRISNVISPRFIPAIR